MIDIIGILTRTWLGVHSPAPQQPAQPVPAAARAKIHAISSAPLVAQSAAGAATGSATAPAAPAKTPATTPAKTPATPAKGSGAADAKTPAADPKTPPAAAPAAAPADANGVVNEVQKFYAGIKQVTAQFRQSVTNNTFGSTKTSDGTVWLMKP